MTPIDISRLPTFKSGPLPLANDFYSYSRERFDPGRLILMCRLHKPSPPFSSEAKRTYISKLPIVIVCAQEVEDASGNQKRIHLLHPEQQLSIPGGYSHGLIPAAEYAEYYCVIDSIHNLVDRIEVGELGLDNDVWRSGLLQAMSERDLHLDGFGTTIEDIESLLSAF